MINVDVRNKKFEVEGTLAELLVNLEYVFADLYIQMKMSKGMEHDAIVDIFNYTRDQGINSALENIEAIGED